MDEATQSKNLTLLGSCLSRESIRSSLHQNKRSK